jgi:two-component system cell cycle sensor histidine kinase/response regulator CckA
MESSRELTGRSPDKTPPPHLLELVYELMTDGVVIQDHHGVVEYANPAMGLLFGCPTGELVGRALSDILGGTPEMPRRSRIGSSTFEAEIRMPDGTVRFLSVKTFGITASPPQDVAIVRDITRKRRTQMELRESEQRFRAIVTSLPIPVLICRSDSGKILYANPAAHKHLRSSDTEIEKHYLGDILPGETTAIGLLKAVKRTGGIRGYECRIRTFADQVLWASLSCESTTYGKHSALLVSILDIDERRRMEEDLRTREERYRRAISQADAVAYEINTDGMQYVFMEEGIEKILGFKPEEMSSQIWLDNTEEIIMRGDAEGLTHAQAMEKSRRGELTSWKADMKVRTKDGQTRWLADSSIPVRDADGKIISYLGILQDITDRKEQEAALWHQEERLRQAHKLEAVGRLAGGISHDFSNLLTAIISYTELALADVRQDSSAHEMLEGVLQTAERGGALIRQILSFSRRQAGTPEPVNINLLVTDMSRLLRRLIGDETSISLALQEGIPDIYADSSRIEQVILNLAVNARDAMPKGGILRIASRTVRLDETQARVTGELKPGLYVELEISDTGTGIPPEVLEHIFEPFFTTKEGGKGTGLGLSTVYGIMQQCGGSIQVDSIPGRGTRFSLLFPPATGGPPNVAPNSVEGVLHAFHASAEGGHTATILLVEDDFMVRQAAARILRLDNYEVLEATGPQEALDVVRRLEQPPHLLLTDLMLDGGSGVELATRLTREYPQMRVVIMTGYNAESIDRVEEHPGQEAWPVLEKPFSMDALSRIIRKALAHLRQ